MQSSSSSGQFSSVTSRPQPDLNTGGSDSSALQAHDPTYKKNTGLFKAFPAKSSHTGGSAFSTPPAYTSEMRESFIYKKHKEIDATAQELQQQINAMKRTDLQSIDAMATKLNEFAKEKSFKSSPKKGRLTRAAKSWRSVSAFFSRCFNFSGKLSSPS